ncbi:MAG: heme exporter protein CcmB [Rhizobiales bacterium]|jgi:heme exporter protein B|nr:heme exporter protein CcmB [Hyphomicrobiales bacterium]MBP9173363.1 heme exporter protein CcmB [Hyphomicrobiales bacterium]
MKLLLALLRRDIILAARQGGGVGTAVGFFLTVLVLLPIGIGPDQATLQRLAPGVLWITLLLSVLLSADRIFQQDFEDGSLEVMAMAPASLELVALTKAVAHWLSTSLPLSIAAPFLGILLNLRTEIIWPLTLAMVLGSFALSLLAGIGASLTLNLRRGGLLISILVLPLYVPILVFGMSATAGNPELIMPSLLILAAITLTSLVLAPIAAAAALRAYLR